MNLEIGKIYILTHPLSTRNVTEDRNVTFEVGSRLKYVGDPYREEYHFEVLNSDTNISINKEMAKRIIDEEGE